MLLLFICFFLKHVEQFMQYCAIKHLFPTFQTSENKCLQNGRYVHQFHTLHKSIRATALLFVHQTTISCDGDHIVQLSNLLAPKFQTKSGFSRIQSIPVNCSLIDHKIKVNPTRAAANRTTIRLSPKVLVNNSSEYSFVSN